MNSTMMHHVGTANMEARLAAAEASRMAKEARRARRASEIGTDHPMDWVRQLISAVTAAFSTHRHAGATGH